MIVQHTDKECKTKFSIGVEFNFSLKEIKESTQKYLIFADTMLYLMYTVGRRG